MELQKRDCGISMRLVPYGGGWTDVYADFGDGELYFIISNTMGRYGFQTLLRTLYYLYPDQQDREDEFDLVEYKEAVYKYIDGKDVLIKICDRSGAEDIPCGIRFVPWKASFSWDEECAGSQWSFERDPTLDTSFDLHIHIVINRKETKEYDYTVRYDDLCYAVADACTKAIKKHGFWGYHQATYTEDMNLRILLFLKAIALGNTEARELTFYDEKGQGETADFNKEMELLLFDM